MPNVADFNFKSSGRRRTDSPSQLNTAGRPIGIRTPLRLGSSNDGIFAMNYDLSTQIRDNLGNLLLTNYGERLGLYDYGANLNELTMELGSEEFDRQVEARVERAVSRWLPLIQLNDFITQVDRSDNENLAQVRLRITYNIPSLQISNQAVEVRFFIAG
jgi:phage baseplate assembly protein W